METYANNNEILDAMRMVTNDFLKGNPNMLDLGCNKPTIFGRRLAKEHRNSEIVHFKDVQTVGEVERLGKRRNMNYVYDGRDLKKSFFDVATAFFVLHEFPIGSLDYGRQKQLELIYQSLKPGSGFMAIDYNLGWVPEVGMNEAQFTEEVFTEKNERDVMKTEENCMIRHSSYGLKQCIEETQQAGFSPSFSKLYHINTSEGVKSKLFLYLGIKK